METLEVFVNGNLERFREVTLADLAWLVFEHLRRVHPKDAHLRNLLLADISPVRGAIQQRVIGECGNHPSESRFQGRLGELRRLVGFPLMEAWGLLVNHGLLVRDEFLAPQGDFFFVSRHGLEIQDSEDFKRAIGMAS